jgi:hypothetical protein
VENRKDFTQVIKHAQLKNHLAKGEDNRVLKFIII